MMGVREKIGSNRLLRESKRISNPAPARGEKQTGARIGEAFSFSVLTTSLRSSPQQERGIRKRWGRSARNDAEEKSLGLVRRNRKHQKKKKNLLWERKPYAEER